MPLFNFCFCSSFISLYVAFSPPWLPVWIAFQVYFNLLNNLRSFGNGPLVIRVGGNSADDWFTFVPSPVEWQMLAIMHQATGARFILDLNLSKKDFQLTTSQVKLLSFIFFVSMSDLQVNQTVSCRIFFRTALTLVLSFIFSWLERMNSFAFVAQKRHYPWLGAHLKSFNLCIWVNDICMYIYIFLWIKVCM